MLSEPLGPFEVELSLGSGNLKQGYPRVEVKISRNGQNLTKRQGELPPNPQLNQLYTDWEFNYRTVYSDLRWRSLVVQPKAGWETDESFVVRISRQDFHTLCDLLKQSLNQWLESDSFKPIREVLSFRWDDFIQLTIEADDRENPPLPWDLWIFFDQYKNAQLAFAPVSRDYVPPPEKLVEQVKILTIIGDSRGLNLEKDQQVIADLQEKDAVAYPLHQPTLAEIRHQLWEGTWDVLFFAGHSSSAEGQGRIYLNETESIAIEELKLGLRHAIDKGLQLAIFNSCDGIRLATALADLNIPAVIVMRAPVPDVVAHRFLQFFLKPLSNGEPLHIALRQACKRLQEDEEEVPCISWLPTLYHNPHNPTPDWQRLRTRLGTGGRMGGRAGFDSRRQSVSLSPQPTGQLVVDSPDKVIATPPQPIVQRNWQTFLRKKVAAIVLVSFLCTTFSMFIRTALWVQHIETPFYDLMMRTRIQEAPFDDRFLLITVGDEDIQWQNELSTSCQGVAGNNLRDDILVKLLELLYKGNPAVVASSIFREFPPCKEVQQKLTSLMQESFQGQPRFLNACSSDDEPPPVLKDLQETHVGFTDMSPDLDQVVRRQTVLAGKLPGAKCTAPYFLSTLTAMYYKNASPDTIDSLIRAGEALFDDQNTYRRWMYANAPGQDQRGGLQILTNYRGSSGNLHAPFTPSTWSLQKILEPSFDPKLIKGKIVLIGTDDPIGKQQRTAKTPYGEETLIFIFAQTTQQMIDVFEGNKSYIKVWPFSQEWLWVYLWSTIVSLVTIQRAKWPLWSILIGTSLLLYLSCYAIFHITFWIPFIPVLFASTLSIAILYGYATWLRLKALPPRSSP